MAKTDFAQAAQFAAIGWLAETDIGRVAADIAAERAVRLDMDLGDGLVARQSERVVFAVRGDAARAAFDAALA